MAICQPVEVARGIASSDEDICFLACSLEVPQGVPCGANAQAVRDT